MRNCTRCGRAIVKGGTEDAFGRCPECRIELAEKDAANLCAVIGCGNPVFVGCDICGMPICEVHTATVVCAEVCPICLPKVRAEAEAMENEQEDWDAEDEDAPGKSGG